MELNMEKPETAERAVASPVRCSRCGKTLRSPHDYILSEKRVLLCTWCYQSLIFPLANRIVGEAMD
jgi:formylmethanofuran dehydrogenase subunit E